MPEEINRLVTDAISDLFFVTEPSGVAHLLREGQPEAAIHHVGHVMVDNVIHQSKRLAEEGLAEGASHEFKARYPEYGVVTLHRPSNVDDAETLTRLVSALKEISLRLPLAFPVHPRTRQNIQKFGIDLGATIILMEPLPYMDFLNLWKDARMILTDSGGLQEETTALGIPSITLRESTERPITVDEGSNVVVGTDPVKILAAANEVFEGRSKAGLRPLLWDGHAAGRIVEVLCR
jgi:UDP-N-acetylglucosamine 2-epimerase (non-hydrolysing)